MNNSLATSNQNFSISASCEYGVFAAARTTPMKSLLSMILEFKDALASTEFITCDIEEVQEIWECVSSDEFMNFHLCLCNVLKCLSESRKTEHILNMTFHKMKLATIC